jgi:hypothetical protein
MRVYVVENNKRDFDTRIEYVGGNARIAQKVCNDKQSSDHPSFIQVWEDGTEQYVTRDLPDNEYRENYD